MSVTVIIAVAVNTNGGREVLGMRVEPSEAEPFWTDFLRSLMRRSAIIRRPRCWPQAASQSPREPGRGPWPLLQDCTAPVAATVFVGAGLPASFYGPSSSLGASGTSFTK